MAIKPLPGVVALPCRAPLLYVLARAVAGASLLQWRRPGFARSGEWGCCADAL